MPRPSPARKPPASLIPTGSSLDQILFANLMEGTEDRIYFKDRQSRFIAISSGLARSFGLSSPADAVGLTDFDFFSEEHARQAFADEQEILRTGAPLLNMVEKETWPDGKATYVTTSKMPLRASSGEIVGIMGISRDISDRVAVEADLEARESELRLHLESLQADLRRAQMIQETMLPEATPFHPHFDLRFHLENLEEVGGDYLAFYPLPSGSLTVMLGDLTGHGMSAALFMALVKFLTDRLAMDCCERVEMLLEAMNAELLDHLPSSFLTLFCGCLVPAESGARLVYGLAGHPEPIQVRAGSGRAEYLPASGNAALGIIPTYNAVPMCAHLESGDRLFLYTDGLLEACNDGGELLGADYLLEIAEQSCQRSLDACIPSILRNIRAYCGDGGLSDDAGLVLVEVRPAG